MKVRVGETFVREGTDWIARTVCTQSNALFEWQHVEAMWTGFGPRPLYADEGRTFFMNRIRKSDGCHL